MQMDEVDQQQQKEIEELKKKDIKHDSLFERIYIFYFLTILAVFVAGLIAYPFLSMKMRPTINVNIDKETLAKIKATPED